MEVIRKIVVEIGLPTTMTSRASASSFAEKIRGKAGKAESEEEASRTNGGTGAKIATWTVSCVTTGFHRRAATRVTKVIHILFRSYGPG